jgi:hypothetical protein
MIEHPTTIVADRFPDPGELPVIDWISKHLVDVDPSYQRPEDKARAEKIAKRFSWSKFGAIVVVPREGGRYAVVDGQHRAAAAILHPLVDHLPAVIMPAVKGASAEAASFIGINGERRAVSGLEMFHARLAAGDEDALTVKGVLDRAGVTVPRHPSAAAQRETIAVSVVQAIVGRRGAMRARQFLDVLVKAECAPITGNALKAVELLSTAAEFAGTFADDDLAETINTMGEAAETDARRFAETHGLPMWKALANVWYQRVRKRRAPAKAPSPAPKAPIRAPAAAPAQQPVPVAGRATSSAVAAQARSAAELAAARAVPADVSNLLNRGGAGRAPIPMHGDPAPGRSALDQRKAG